MQLCVYFMQSMEPDQYKLVSALNWNPWLVIKLSSNIYIATAWTDDKIYYCNSIFSFYNSTTLADLHTKFSGARRPPLTGPNSFIFTYIFTKKHPPPYGTQFFHFHIHFYQKAPSLEVHALPKQVHAPLREILDPPLNHFIFHSVSFSLYFIIYIDYIFENVSEKAASSIYRFFSS